MKRTTLALAAIALITGCNQPNPSVTQDTKSADSYPAVADASKKSDTAKTASASTAKPPSAKEYYEVNKNGKTYVFGKLDSVLAFRSKGTVPAGAIEKAGPNGEPVVYEADGLEAGLMADYAKSHPKK